MLKVILPLILLAIGVAAYAYYSNYDYVPPEVSDETVLSLDKNFQNSHELVSGDTEPKKIQNSHELVSGDTEPKKRRIKIKSYLRDELINEGAEEVKGKMKKGIIEYDLDSIVNVFDNASKINDFSESLSYVLASELSDFEKEFLIKRLFENSEHKGVDLLNKVTSEMDNFRTSLSDEIANSLLLHSVSVSARDYIASTLEHLDKNHNILADLNYSSETTKEQFKKLLYENAYHSNLKANDFYSLVHILNNPVFGNDSKAFQNLFRDVDHSVGIEWLKQSKALLTEEQFANALRNLVSKSYLEQGLVGTNGEHAVKLNDLVSNRNFEEAKVYANLLKDDPEKVGFLRNFISNLAIQDFDEAKQWLSTVDNEIVKDDLHKNLAHYQVQLNYERTLNWAQNLEEGSTAQAYALSNIAIQQATHNYLHHQSTDWFSSLPNGFVKDRTEIGYALGMSRFHNDVGLEFTLKEMFVKDKFDRETSKVAVQNSKLPGSVKNKIIKILEK